MNKPIRKDHVEEADEPITGLPAAYASENQSLAVSLARAEVDQQIATARSLPRRPKSVMDAILSLATLDDRTAEECVYALPRAGKPIKGPSIRLAEIIGSQWGNCRIGARVVHVDRFEKYVEAEGVFHDLETNTATTARVRRPLVGKNGRLYSDDMIVVTGNAACSIAKRNAILGGVPKAVWRKAYDAVEAVVAGDAVTLVERRGKAMKAFAAFGCTPERVCVGLGVASVEEITLEHMPVLMGAHSALKNGEATIEELFPPLGKDTPEGERLSLADRLDALAKGDEKPDTEAVAKDGAGNATGDQSKPEAEGDAPTRQASAHKPPPSEPTKPDGGGNNPTIAEANADGIAARAKGMSRKAVPIKFQQSDKLREAFLAGFDSGEAERQPGEEG